MLPDVERFASGRAEEERRGKEKNEEKGGEDDGHALFTKERWGNKESRNRSKRPSKGAVGE